MLHQKNTLSKNILALFDDKNPLIWIVTLALTSQIEKLLENAKVSIIVSAIAGGVLWFYYRRKNEERLKKISYTVESPLPPEPSEGLILLLSPYFDRANPDKITIDSQIDLNSVGYIPRSLLRSVKTASERVLLSEAEPRSVRGVAK